MMSQVGKDGEEEIGNSTTASLRGPALKGTDLWGQTPTNGFLWFSAKVFGFCGFLHLYMLEVPGAEEVNLGKSARSAQVCVCRSVCPP